MTVLTQKPSVSLRDDPSYVAAAARLEALKRDAAELDRRREQEVPPGRARTAVEDQLEAVRRDIEAQRQVVAGERARVSREICARVAPQYRARVSRLHAALLEAAAAQRDLRDLLGELEAGGVEYLGELRPMFFMAGSSDAFGDSRDYHSPLATWLREAGDYGLLTTGGQR